MSRAAPPPSGTPGDPGAAAVRLDVSAPGIGWLVLDAPGRKVNVLSTGVMEAIDRLLDEAADRTDIKALAVISGKPGTFIAGADLAEIGAIRTIEEGEGKARRGQSIFHRLGGLGKPTLAAIDGVCLGGGLEMALACTFRLATDSPETRLGLPEVRLGFIPGFGGTQRLPRLIGLPAALTMILTSGMIDAAKAQRLGLVDRMVPAPLLRAQAELWLMHAVEKTRHGHPWARLARRTRPRLTARLMAAPAVRPLVLRSARRRLDRTLRGIYPAPYVALDAIDTAFHRKLEAGLPIEAGLTGTLLVSPTCRNLTWVFRAGQEARRESRALQPAAGAPADDLRGAARPVRRAAVLGAGVMGSGIVHLLAERGIPVRLKDVDAPALVRGMRSAARLVDSEVSKGRIDRREAARRMACIAPTLTWDGFRGADCVIEAVSEDLAVKRAVLAEAEARIGPECLFATNTSSLPIGEIAREARHPERVVGLHFFNPAHRMLLVEVIAGVRSAPEAVATAHDLARRLGKTPIVVRDTPGFLVNRILMAYLAEALKMFVDGADPAIIDRAMLHFGMPLGPFALLDQIGLDTAARATRSIEAVNERHLPRVSVLARLVESGRLGVRHGRGFYHYRRGRRLGFDKAVHKLLERADGETPDLETIQSRLYLPMVNESVRCLAAGVARQAADIDLGLVLGAGFPPFRGGPLRNADTMGIPAVVERMNALAEKVGERLAPEPILVEMGLGGRRFYTET